MAGSRSGAFKIESPPTRAAMVLPNWDVLAFPPRSNDFTFPSAMTHTPIIISKGKKRCPCCGRGCRVLGDAP